MVRKLRYFIGVLYRESTSVSRVLYSYLMFTIVSVHISLIKANIKHYHMYIQSISK